MNNRMAETRQCLGSAVSEVIIDAWSPFEMGLLTHRYGTRRLVVMRIGQVCLRQSACAVNDKTKEYNLPTDNPFVPSIAGHVLRASSQILCCNFKASAVWKLVSYPRRRRRTLHEAQPNPGLRHVRMHT